MSEGPTFEIPVRPERSYPFHGGVEYEGSTTFILKPDESCSELELERLVSTILTDGPYRHGDFLNLPMPLYLVKDTQTGDVFRLSVRNSTIRLHVLPETEPEGLRGIYDRLHERTDCDWTVECQVESVERR